METAAFGGGSGARIPVPALIRRYRFAAMYVLLWAPYIAAYQISNRFPLRTPVELPMSAVDAALPFVPLLLPVYVAYLPFYFWSVVRSRSDAEVNRIFYGSYLQLALSLPFFLFLPVTFPRELFYGAATFGWADTFWRWFDAPNNCFPSLHASNCLLLMQFNWHRPWPWLHTAVAAAIIASTVLVKQHYVVDVLGGVAVYAVTRWVLNHVRIAGHE